MLFLYAKYLPLMPKCLLTAAAPAPICPHQLRRLQPVFANVLSPCEGFRHIAQRPRPHVQRQNVRTSAAADLLSIGFLTAATAGLVYSATPLLTGKSKQDNQGKSDTYGETDAEPEGIKWGVMSVVSFIPLVNWTV